MGLREALRLFSLKTYWMIENLKWIENCLFMIKRVFIKNLGTRTETASKRSHVLSGKFYQIALQLSSMIPFKIVIFHALCV